MPSSNKLQACLSVKLTVTDIHRCSWGESAGAFSVAAHLAWNEGDPEGLFRAAVMVRLSSPARDLVGDPAS